MRVALLAALAGFAVAQQAGVLDHMGGSDHRSGDDDAVSSDSSSHSHSSALVRPLWFGSQWLGSQSVSPHVLHSLAWPPVEYLPAGHAVQEPAPAAEYVPAGQAGHEE